MRSRSWRHALDSGADFTETEVQCCQSVCDGTWRLNRIYADECAIHALGLREYLKQEGMAEADATESDRALARAYTLRNWAKELEQLSRFEQRLARKRERDIGLLRELQAARRAMVEKECFRYKHIRLYHTLTNEPFDPDQFGFVSRTEDMDQEIAKNLLVDKALRLKKESANPPDQAA